jgi:hypothetical protein
LNIWDNLGQTVTSASRIAPSIVAGPRGQPF